MSRPLPQPPAQVADEEVQAALARCCDPELIRRLADALSTPTGRPRLLTVQGLLAGMQLCAEHH